MERMQTGIEHSHQPPRVTWARPATDPVSSAAIVRARATPLISLPTISRTDAVVDLLLVLAGGLIIPFGGEIALSILLQHSRLAFYAENPWVLFAAKTMSAVWVTVLALLIARMRGISIVSFGFSFTGWKPQALWSASACGGVMIGFGIGVFLSLIAIQFLPADFLKNEEQQKLEFMKILPLDRLWVGYLLMISVAIHEEILFRGLMLPYLRRIGLPWAGAIIAGSILFGSLHFAQGPMGMLVVTFVGLALALFFVLSRSLIPVMVAHCLFNCGQLTMMKVVIDLQKQASDAGISP